MTPKVVLKIQKTAGRRTAVWANADLFGASGANLKQTEIFKKE